MAAYEGNMLIAHGGGPTPVINSSLQGAVEEARAHTGIQRVYGARYGVEGLLRADFISLGDIAEGEIAKLAHTPASALGSCRRKLVDEDYARVMQVLKAHNIRYFFYNGGNDSMDTCNKIHQLAEKEGYGIRVIGIPKTIDNDLAQTDHSPGYASAARYAAQSALELAMDAAALPIHVIVMEVMGRNAGWITAAASLYSRQMPCAHLVYLPEVRLARTKFLEDVQKAWEQGRGLLVTVSEGLRDETGKAYGDSGVVDGFGHSIPGGTAQALVDEILKHTGLKARAEKPGLLGRVNMACQSAIDRQEAYEAGAFAVRSAAEGKSGYMVAIRAERTPAYRAGMQLVPLEMVANVEKTFPAEWIVQEGTGIADAFAAYCGPLLDAAPPQFAWFAGKDGE